MKTVLVTGSQGFIGKNLCAQLELIEGVVVLKYSRRNNPEQLAKFVKEADFIFHVAGVNRPKNEKDFITDNRDLTKQIISLQKSAGSKAPIVFTSSTQAALDNAYGKSKLAAETALIKWHKESNKPDLYLSAAGCIR